jgi:hypothetical protein
MGILMPILGTLGTVALHMLTQLMTEKVLKKMIILGLEKLAARTQTDVDDQLVKAAKEAWEDKPTPEAP